MLDIDFDSILRRTPPMESHLERLSSIEGWLTNEAIDFTSRLFHLQRALNQARGILELGVFKGKYLALLAAFCVADAPVVGVDGFLARLGEPLEPKWRATAEQTIRDNVALIIGTERPVTLIGGFTRDVDISKIVECCPDGYSFISVDAGHEVDDLVVDLGIAAAVAASDAIIALDDVFNPLVPGVAEGVSRYFSDNPSCSFRPFAICGNKVFLSGARMHATYIAYAKWLLRVATDASYIHKSAAIEKQNQELGFIPRFLGHEVVTFVGREAVTFGWN